MTMKSIKLAYKCFNRINSYLKKINSPITVGLAPHRPYIWIYKKWRREPIYWDLSADKK